MKPISVDDCLAPCQPLLKLIKISLRDSVLSGYDSLSELVVALETIIIFLSQIL
jgi:hypothetical protein